MSEHSDKNIRFTHKVDKSLIPTCNIMGVNIAAIDMDWLLNFTEKLVKIHFFIFSE